MDDGDGYYRMIKKKQYKSMDIIYKYIKWNKQTSYVFMILISQLSI